MLNLEEPPLGYEKGFSVCVPLQSLAILLTRMLVRANYSGEFNGPNSCSVGIGLKTTKLFHVSQTDIWLVK